MDKQSQALEARYIRDKAQRHLQSAINTLQQNMYEMECYLENFDSAMADAERAKIINRAINHLVCSIQPNLRIDLLAESQAELAVLACGERGNEPV